MAVNIYTTSDNIVSNKYATFGDTITVSLVTNLSVDTVTGTLNGIALSFNQNGNNYTSSYLVTEDSTNGQVNISITFSGNTYNSITGDVVTIDLEKPTATLNYSTSGENVLFPRIGDEIYLELTTNKELSSFPKISFSSVRTFSNENKTFTNAEDFVWTKQSTLVWLATYTITSKSLLPHNIYIDFFDKAGNVGTIYTELSYQNHYYDFIWSDIQW